MEAPPQANKECPRYSPRHKHKARRPSAGWVISWHPKLPPCGVPLRSPRGEMDHVAACCSRNGKHPRDCSHSAVPRIQEMAREAKFPPCAPCHSVREWGAGFAGEQPLPSPLAAWVIVPRWGLSTPVSLRYVLRVLHPHSWDTWRPRVHLLLPDSITCQIPSVSPRAETLSSHLLPLHTCLVPVQILKPGQV